MSVEFTAEYIRVASGLDQKTRVFRLIWNIVVRINSNSNANLGFDWVTISYNFIQQHNRTRSMHKWPAYRIF